MENRMVFVFGADVQGAIRGMEQVTDRLRSTAAAGQSLGQGFSRSTQQAVNSLTRLSPASNQATFALTNLSRVVQDAPYGFIGIANNLNPLLESFQRLKQSTGSTGGALKALGQSMTGAGGLGIALSLVTTGLLIFQNGFQSFSRKTKEAKEQTDGLRDSIKGIFSEVGKEAAGVGTLVTLLKSETETRERKLGAIKELQRIQPDIFEGLKLEGSAVIGLDKAYKDYLANLQNVVAAKIIQARLEQEITKLLTLQGAAASTPLEKFIAEGGVLKTLADKSKGPEARNFYLNLLGADKKKKDAAADLIRANIDNLFTQLQQFTKQIKINIKSTAGSGELKKLDLKVDKISLFGELGERPTTGAKRISDAAKDPIISPKRLEELKRRQSIIDYMNERTAEGFRRQRQEAEMLADTVSGTLAPAFSSMFEAILSGKDPLRAMFQTLIQSIQQLVSELIQAAIRALVLKIIATAGTGGTSGLLSIASSFNFGGRATGGPVSAGKPYVVGEAGKELFIPSSSGRIIPNNSLNGLQGMAVPQISFNGRLAVSGSELKLLLNRTDRYQAANV